MNKQEKIRHTVMATFRELKADTILKRELNSYHYADKLLQDLHSQGVVIRVDKELPSIEHEMMAEDMGLVAVEPLTIK